MNNSTYICPRCGNNILASNRMLHDLRCQGGNNQNHYSNFNQNISSSSYNFGNFNNNNMMINNNIISINDNTTSNPDGTTTQTKTEKYPNGMEKTTVTRYDRNGNIISQMVNSTNANNNFNFNNNNFAINNNANNNANVQRIVDQFGNVTETKIEQLGNGQTRTSSITRDRNGNIIGQSMSNNLGVNNINNMQSFNMSMNNFNNAMNNMNNMMSGMNNMMGGMNNMMSGMNNMMNGMNNMNSMNNMSNMNNRMNGMNSMSDMSNMNNMMNNMGNMMNQMFNNIFNNNNMGNIDFNNMNNIMNNENLGNGVDPSIINNLPSSKLKDISKLDDDKKNCIICLEDFRIDDEVIFLPCLHIFHRDCIIEWLKNHDDCPVCKNKVD